MTTHVGVWRSPKVAASTAGAFIRRDWRIATSYRLPFALELVSVATGLVMFFFLGQLIDRSETALSPELTNGYFSFALVGLTVLRIVQTSLSSFSSKLRREQTTGTLEALLASPPPAGFVILASAAYDLMYATVSAAVTFTIGLMLGASISVSWQAAVAVAVGIPTLLALFAAIGVAVAAFTMLFKQASQMVGLLTTALALSGGVYFPLDVLPGPLEGIARALPTTWGIDMLRRAILVGELNATLMVGLVISAIVSLPVSLLLFRRAVDRSRRTGSLSQY